MHKYCFTEVLLPQRFRRQHMGPQYGIGQLMSMHCLLHRGHFKLQSAAPSASFFLHLTEQLYILSKF